MDTWCGPSFIFRRLVPNTVNPALARASALARPIPVEAPVRIAVFPECALISFSSLRVAGLAGSYMMIIIYIGQ
jgi:hypothetical protein